MPAAAIRINGVTGSNLDLPIDTLVTLTNQNTGGEVSYAWSIVDQPDGAADALSGASGPSVTFTPKKEGTYLLNLVVNGSLENQAVAAVRHLKTRIRVPAGSETDEAASAPRGWATDANIVLDLLDDTRADGGIVVGQAGENLTRGQVIRLSSSATIKAGLPGQEMVPVWVKAAADTTDNARGVLGIADVAVDGSGITSGDLFYARVTGLFQAGAVGGAPALGSVVFLSDTLGAMNTTAGTVRRVLGRIVAANGGSWDIAFAGAGAFDDSAAGVPASRTLQGTSPIAIAGGYSAVDLSANRVISFAITGETNGDLVYRTGGAWTRLPIGTDAHILTLSGGLPIWAANTATPTSRTLQGTSPIAIDGAYAAVNFTANRVISLAVAGEANGDIMVRAGGAWTRLAAGTNGHVLTLTAGAPAWAAPAASSITIASSTLSGGGTGSSFTLNVAYGTTANTALQGTNDALYVHIAGAENVTGAKTFDATVTLGVSSDLRADTGSGIIIAYRLSGGVHEFGTASANVLVNGLTATEMKTGTSVRYVQSATTHSWYTATALKMTLGSGLHVGTTAVSRSNGEFSAATAIVQGTAARDASAVLDLQSTALGTLLTRMDTTARNAIASPATSLLIYNTTNARHEWWDGAAWRPLGSSGTTPFYLAGPAGSGPGGISPQYATLTAMMNAMVADGASSASPRVGFFVGAITENPTLRDGCYVAGLSDTRSPAAHTIVGRVDFQPSVASASGLANCTIDNSAAAGVEAFLFRPTAGSSVMLAGVRAYGGTGAGTPAFDLDGSVDPDDSIVQMDGCYGQGVWGARVEKMEVRISGSLKGNASASEPARSIRGTNGAIIRFERAPNGEDRAASYTNATILDLQGAVELDVLSSLYLGVGVNVVGSSDFTVGPVYSETPLFKLSDDSSLHLAGNHHFAMDDESVYLFGTADTGSVFAAGDYRLDEDTYPLAQYLTQSGITVNSVQCLTPERVQLITAADTIGNRTTLAIIIPAAGTTFAITMPPPAGFGPERKLRVKYTGGTNKQDLSLDAYASSDIDYDSAKNSITLKWNDGYHFAAYGGKWVILSRNVAAGSSGGATYTYVPLVKGGFYTVGNGSLLIGGGAFYTAEHDLTGGRTIKFRAVMHVANQTASEECDVTLYSTSTPGGIVTLSTASAVEGNIEISADLSASFTTDEGCWVRVSGDTGTQDDWCLSAELVIGP